MTVTFEPLEADLAIHQKLDDEPNDVGGLTAGELKEKFDEAGLTIQRYLNETHLPQVSQRLEEALEEARRYADGKVAAIGAGDMAQGVYDPQRLERDVYAYARETAREAVGDADKFGCVAAGRCQGTLLAAGETPVTLRDFVDPRGLWSPEEGAFTVPWGARAMLLTLHVKWAREGSSTCRVEALVNGTAQAVITGPDNISGSYVWETVLLPLAVRGGDRVELKLKVTTVQGQQAEVYANYLRAEIIV